MVGTFVKCIYIYCFYIKEIKIFFKTIFDIIKKLDCDARANIYIGITGILVAIVIFIAEIISSKNIETYKKLLLEKTKLKKNVKEMIITMALIWIGEIIKFQDSIIIYFCVQLLIDIKILISMIQTFCTFSEVIKLNTNKEYFDNQLIEFIYNKIEKNIKLNEKNKIKLEEKNKDFFEYIKKSKLFKFEQSSIILEDGYSTIESNKYGYITSYDYFILNQIEQNLKIQIKNADNSNNISENISNNQQEICICKKIGDKCVKGYPIAYYKNVKAELINMINRAVIIDNQDYINYDKEIAKIIDDVFIIAFQNQSSEDDENILLMVYEFICKKKYESIIATFLDRIDHIYREINDIEENKKFCSFLNKLMFRSFNNNRYEDFNKIGKYITELYINRMKIDGIDLKYIAYRYANDIFLFNNYTIKRKGDYKYYDIIMANLLLMIKEYLKMNNIEAVLVLFDNIHFEKNNYYIEKEWNDYDIVNFQFIIAVIYLILYTYKKEENKNKEISSDFIENISKLINMLEDKFFKLYDMWDTILKFNKFSKKRSEILNIIEHVDLDSDSHKYKSSWSNNPIDINEVLKCIIYMFEIQYVDIKKIKKEDISRKEKNKYDQLLRVFQNSTFGKLEEIYDYDCKYKKDAVELISKAIEIEEEKEKEYELTAEIDIEKEKKFKEIIIRNSNKKSKIEELIYNIGKIKENKVKLKRTFGMSELIPRSWFIKDNNIYTDNIAEDFGKAFTRGIEKEVIDYIINQSIISNETLENTINSISNIDDYILLADKSILRNFKYTYDNEHVNINGKKIYTIFSLKVENFILINKQALPNIELCKFDDSYNNKNIIGNMYIEITDCANNEQRREKIIKENKWLQKKGNVEEQDNYLKGMCDFKAFKSFRILESDIKDSYIIKK